MITKQEVETAFRSELQALLDKWGAEIEAGDHFIGYEECGQDIRMTVSIPCRYTEHGEVTREHTEIDLGNWIWPSEKKAPSSSPSSSA